MSKLIVAILLSSLSLFAVEWRTYESALVEQQKTGKLIMIDVVRLGCRYCVYMDKVFENKEASKWLTERFIPVKLNLDYDDLPLGIKVVVTPTFYFIDKNEKIVKAIPSSWCIEDFKSLTEKLQ